MTRLDVVQAVRDDGRLLGDEDATDQGRRVGPESQLVETHLVEEPALPHARRCGRGDQRLEPLLVEEQAAHFDIEQFSQFGAQGTQVLAQLGQIRDGGRGLEEVAQLLEILIGAQRELEV